MTKVDFIFDIEKLGYNLYLIRLDFCLQYILSPPTHMYMLSGVSQPGIFGSNFISLPFCLHLSILFCHKKIRNKWLKEKHQPTAHTKEFFHHIQTCYTMM